MRIIVLCFLFLITEHRSMISNFYKDKDFDEKIYVISLKRTPERFEKVKKQLDAFGIKCERFEAIDGYDLEFLNVKTKKFLNENLKKDFFHYTWSIKPVTYTVMLNNKKLMDITVKNAHFSLGEIGCACSHREIWKEVVSKNYSRVIVLEDDVIFEKDFKIKLIGYINDLPNDWDIAFLGVGRRHNHNGYFVNVGEIFRDIDEVKNHPFVARIQPSNLTYGMYGYIINPKGAKKLLKITDESNFPIDDIVFQQGGINTGFVKGYVYMFKLLEPNLNNSEIRKMGRNY